MERQGHLLHGGYRSALATQLPQDKLGKPAGDHFIVEELLDFSDEDDAGTAADDDGGSDAARGNCSAGSFTITATDSCINSFSAGYDALFSDKLICRSLADAGLSGDLHEPVEELQELEWVSSFFEEPFSSEELQNQQLLSGMKTTSSLPSHQDNYTFAAEAAAGDDSMPFTPEGGLPGKARSKRARTAPCSWSSRLMLLAPTTESSSPENSGAATTQPNPVKQPSKKKELLLASLAPALDGRRCLHCATDKTPQWRAGPMGPKTLCNACGVRYKSGRLVPEYRPAASPTFVNSKHSNSHRKVLEIRRQKEVHEQQYLPVYNNAVASAAAAAAAAVAAGDEYLMQHRLLPDFRPVFG